MTTFEQNVEQIADLQKKGLEPVRNFSAFAVEAFEKNSGKGGSVGHETQHPPSPGRKLSAFPVEPLNPRTILEVTQAESLPL